jgi:hypothetical protein
MVSIPGLALWIFQLLLGIIFFHLVIILMALAQEIEQRKVLKHTSLEIKVATKRISALFAVLDYKMEVVIEDLFEIKPTSEKSSRPTGTRIVISTPVKEEELALENLIIKKISIYDSHRSNRR